MDPSEIDSGTITYSLQSDLGDALPFAVETQQAITGYVGVIKVSGYVNCRQTNILSLCSSLIFVQFIFK